jgi:hypothetical protein
MMKNSNEVVVAVLKEAEIFEPTSAYKVVQAIPDYETYLKFDDVGNLVKRSAKKLVQALVMNEPNLFNKTDIPEDNSDGFKGKAPKSGTKAVQTKAEAKEKKKNEALALMGIKKQ